MEESINVLVQLGVGGIFCVMVLRLVFDFLGKKKFAKNDVCLTPAIIQQIKDLWDWHNKTDDEGVKVWYVRRSLEKAIERLAENTDTQTKIFTELVHEIKDMRRDINQNRKTG